MAFSNPVITPSSGEPLVNGLLWDHHWDDGVAGKSTKLAVYIAGTSGNPIIPMVIPQQAVDQGLTAGRRNDGI